AVRGGPGELLAAPDERVRELDDLEQVDDVQGRPEGQDADDGVDGDVRGLPVAVRVRRREVRGEGAEREGAAPDVQVGDRAALREAERLEAVVQVRLVGD